MAKTDNLTDYLIDLADGIRAKKGTTEPINPQDFRAEIESIEGGGGASESSIEYLDMTNVQSESWMTYLLASTLFVKQWMTLGQDTINTVFPTVLSQVMAGNLLGVNQFAIDFKAPIVVSKDGMAQTMTVADFIIQQGATQEKLDAIPRLTKEEFYSLE